MLSRTILIVSSLLVAMATSAQAAVELIDFKADPITSTMPEVVWNGGLSAGSGAVSTGLVGAGYDGDQAEGSQVAGGLQIGTGVAMTLAPHAVPVAGGGTAFYDCSLSWTGLAANGPAFNLSGTIVQSLGAGTFTVADTAGNVLLTGDVKDATMTLLAGSISGSALSASVTYTGGSIFNAIQGSVTDYSGTFSLALSSSTPYSLNGGVLGGFEANAEGHFDVPAIPEPGVLAMVGLAVLGLRRRRA